MILGCFVSFSTAQTIPITARELTTSSSRFSNVVSTIIAHPHNPKLLVISDYYSIWVFNPTTAVKTLIAGSSISGYVEGLGSSARFDAISGSSYFNKSTVLVVEHYSHCVRFVNLISKFTERYAGVCLTAGKADGARLSAQFYHPWGILQVNSTFFISEWKNNLIRKIQNDIVSTLTSTLTNPSGLAWNGVNLLFIFQHGVGEISIRSNQQTLLTGVEGSAGYTNGNMNSIRFNNPRFVVVLTEKTFLVSDRENKVLRLVDLTKQLVSSLTINEFGSSKPEGISIYDGEVLVGLHDGRVLGFPIDSLPVSLPVVSCNADATLTIPDNDFSVLFAPNTINATSIKCIDCPMEQNLTVGVYEFEYKYQSVSGWTYKSCNQTVTVITETPEVNCPLNQNFTIPTGQESHYFTLPKIDIANPRLRCVSCPLSGKVLYEGVYTEKITYIDVITNQSLECSYQINVQRLTPPCFNETQKIFLQKQQIKTDKIKAGSCGVGLLLTPGVTEIIVEENCYQKYEVFSPVEVVCPGDIAVTLPDNSNKTNITIPQPQVDKPRLSCINCPDSDNVFGEGVHNVTFMYFDNYYNETTSCSYTLTVIKPETPPVCTNETVHIYLEKNETKSKYIKIDELAAKLRLDLGSVLEVEINNGCFKIYKVYEWSEMMRRVQLQASYKMKCASLNQVSFIGIDVSLKHATKTLKTFCSECNIRAGKADIQCINDTVTVIWKTDITSAQQWLDENEKERTTLIGSLNKYQKKFPEIDITALIGLVPRTISPVKDASGFYIQVETKSECVDRNFIYNRTADVCVRTKCH